MSTLAEVYDAAFFAEHLPWRQEYDAMAGALAELLAFESVLDLGCGSAYLMASLHARGKTVRGVDGSFHALAAAPPEVAASISVADLRLPLHTEPADLVICSEVAEHLPPDAADTLVDNLCRHARRAVYFTAATPGQGGREHHNEQPHAYWVEKFRQRGFAIAEQATSTLRRKLAPALREVWWFTDNSFIFVPAP